MKTKIISLITIIASLIACTTGKYTSNYKAERSNIDSLTILTPWVLVEENDGENRKSNLLIEESNRMIISKITEKLLSSKYSIINQEFIYEDTKEFLEFCNKLEFSGDKLEGQIVPNGFLDNIENPQTKYGLLLIYRAEFNPVYEPHYNLKAGIQTSYIIIDPQTKPSSDLRLLVINFQSEEVAHYSSKISKSHDPRVPDDVEFLTKAILKSVYYN